MSVEKIMSGGDDSTFNKQSSFKQPFQKQSSLPMIVDNDEEDPEESGLMFINPDDEKKLKQEQDNQLKKKEIPMIKLKDGSLIPSAFVSAPGSGAANGMTADKSIKQRYNFM